MANVSNNTDTILTVKHLTSLVGYARLVFEPRKETEYDTCQKHLLSMAKGIFSFTKQLFSESKISETMP